MNKESVAKTIDEYIARFPDEIAIRLQKVRETIRGVAPDAEEGISYQIPVFKLHGPMVYFAGYRTHIGFYPTSSGIERFKEELSEFKIGRGTVRFPLNKEIPYDLIARITAFRYAENIAKKKQ
ncbi:iron chaperone [Paludibacter jiangxiensis]|uniref:YdhG-like domain-containing protein n=1 Tax=Paludibacter jiangxiensis TaxID=681398 RepID=A0A161M5R6_9BACT|nr:DUF1801 domain-containing protein [Paludibacter jiangxiensis]GAT63803.1 hypothetical protein PJIAN_4345 [Paludibacter jiangxiensis]